VKVFILLFWMFVSYASFGFCFARTLFCFHFLVGWSVCFGYLIVFLFADCFIYLFIYLFIFIFLCLEWLVGHLAVYIYVFIFTFFNKTFSSSLIYLYGYYDDDSISKYSVASCQGLPFP